MAVARAILARSQAAIQCGISAWGTEHIAKNDSNLGRLGSLFPVTISPIVLFPILSHGVRPGRPESLCEAFSIHSYERPRRRRRFSRQAARSFAVCTCAGSEPAGSCGPFG